MQSIKDECIEFDQQYNHVLNCWRQAEERSKTYEMELRSEIGLCHEVREYLGEMQQHFGNFVQEDWCWVENPRARGNNQQRPSSISSITVQSS